MKDLAQLLAAHIREVPDFPQPGIAFKDITPILQQPALMLQAAQALAAPFQQAGITQVVGIESRGFLFGPLMAQVLQCGFVVVRKKGKLPPETLYTDYTLEYGSATIEIQNHALQSHDRVLVHDDLLATGGTATAAAQLVHQLGAQLAGFTFLIELSFLSGRAALQPFGCQVQAVLSYH